jgi:tRNA G46 methylase TrmB
MFANSSPVTSAQSGVHEQLSALVARHATHPFRKPILAHNREAFERAAEAWQAAGGKPLILDAGCGVGLSTLHLAARFPEHFVLGIDQSADRIARRNAWPGELPRNCIAIRADLVDFWRLMLENDARPVQHYLLYPNPWPKIGQLARRWQGHPVFPTIVALGGSIECRSNWSIYIDEFAAAITQLTGIAVHREPYLPTVPITPFEHKYQASGHALWRCRVDLSALPAAQHEAA